MSKREDIKLPERVRLLCQQYRTCCLNVETRQECERFRQELGQLFREILPCIADGGTELWIALLDAYEVTRDEGMLQEVLDVVSGGLERLEVSADGVKLLAYCYYYVEEEECAERAKRMLEELRRRGDEVTEAEKVLEELF